MILLNFSHILSDDQLSAIEKMTAGRIERVERVLVQFDPNQPFLPQMLALVDGLSFTPEEWELLPILVNPPSLNTITAVLLAELHGRMGHFPSIIRLRPVEGSLPTRYEVAEIFNLQAVREESRKKRRL
jgi:hypothetical protein